MYVLQDWMVVNSMGDPPQFPGTNYITVKPVIAETNPPVLLYTKNMA